ncbi:3-hydroxyacyl-CoA dehydrogenase NAD-binding domain-containing protein [Marinobacterium aestuariivivens]|uniref:3-hydroxyacyl-CoA dehydrogenase NAD-binding domain-containing protein n=1 Tax=Marinobacterium aestuariivivens TaxID=1698799 RepID=A0ABW2A1Z5_9GAMM
MEIFKRIGVVGAGAMGRGIVQLFATCGIEVRLHDSRPEAIDEALFHNRALLERAHKKGRLSAETLARALACMTAADELDRLADCDLVVEAIVEQLDAKQALLRELEARVAPDAVLATNTSSLSVAAIASVCRHPERVAGLHFFNPVPLMKIAEVVQAGRTAPEVGERLVALVERAGHFAARVPDSPGFLVNHAGRAYGPEALRILAEGIATPAQIDRIMRDCLGFPMGPFELFDLMGLDVSHSVMCSVHDQFYQDARYTPSALVPPRLAAGLLGRKSGEGFYRYTDGKPVLDESAEVATVSLEQPFWLDCEDAGMRDKIAAVLAAAGAELESGDSPSTRAICLVTPWARIPAA